MDWTYRGELFTEPDNRYIGFVYIITNLVTDKKYIGKKLFKFRKSKSVKGKRKKYLAESDWQDYWSSSDTLKEDVKKLGENNFSREILHLCTSRTNLNYLELREQIDRRVLETDGWYNSFVGTRINRRHLKTDEL